MKQIAFLLLVANLTFFTPLPVHAAGPTDFVSCYELNETSGTRNDSNTTNANHLTDINTVLSGTGKQGNAADFESSASEALEDATTSGLPTGNGSRSIVAWVNFESLPGVDTARYIVDYGNAVNDQEFNLAVVNLGGTHSFWMDRYGAATISASTAFSTGTWYFLVITYDGTSVRWYINNSLHDTKAVGVSLNTGNDDLNLGRKGVGAENQAFIDGLMDIVEIYDSVLTAGEMTELYNAGSGVACAGRASVAETPRQAQGIIFFE